MTDNNDKKRLDALNKAITNYKDKSPFIRKPNLNKQDSTNNNASSGLALMSRICIELVAGITVGSILGVYIDRYFDTAPLFLIILIILGLAGSMFNIYKMIKKLN